MQANDSWIEIFEVTKELPGKQTWGCFTLYSQWKGEREKIVKSHKSLKF